MRDIHALVEKIKRDIEERKKLGYINHKVELPDDEAESVQKHLQKANYTVKEDAATAWGLGQDDDDGPPKTRLIITWSE